ncbi:extracellular solute-binding protein [Natronolimnohabitans sp. A-GB9]|uniref:extracellular solute-binding protein n=1 Tax=Natronolimnohabitans sp. A-GB9 TaxID=3069757 RepID=UPI0027B0E4CB|nr:extracellular solute-binding protein [Natronolimnohabitans sp. A-GB9]MDQ2050279.1 extracellular solute-binding protein [Natronolimnohabitans sp. A-GB9]
MQQRDSDSTQRSTIGRRPFLAATGVSVAGLTGLAGCLGDDGDLTIYSGRSEEQISPIFRKIEEEMGITIADRYGDSAGMVGQIVEESEDQRPDLFYTQDSGTLGQLKAEGLTAELTDDVVETVPEEYRDPDETWTGVSGRTRSIAYNTDEWDADDIPDDILAFDDDERFEDELGWRIDSGSFLSFIRAMMIEYGEDDTEAWIEGLQDLGITGYEGGMATPQAIADGEISVGFVNHYYVGRHLEDDEDAPINVTYTDGDVGSLFNVSGVAIVDGTDEMDLAQEFVETVISPEIQEEFVDLNAEYPVIDDVEYVGDMPQLDELNPPSFDLNELADVEPAQDLLRDVGVL